MCRNLISTKTFKFIEKILLANTKRYSSEPKLLRKKKPDANRSRKKPGVKRPEVKKTKLDYIAERIAKLTKPQAVKEIMKFEGSFKLDFTEEHLKSLPINKLKHILLAAELNRLNSL